MSAEPNLFASIYWPKIKHRDIEKAANNFLLSLPNDRWYKTAKI